MKQLLILLTFSLLLTNLPAQNKTEVRYFFLTIDQIHQGKAVETHNVRDTNRDRDIPGEHIIRIDTTKYELYDGQKISVVVVDDGVVKSVDGSRTLKAWKLVPGEPVKLH